MSDLISRQDAMTLPVLPKEYRQYQTTNLDDAYDLGWDDCQMHLNSLPSVQQEPKTGKWIPCSERYPEENQICIVTDETMKNTYEYRFCKETYDENQGWTYLKHRIIAWMPLPKPYQEDNQ